MPSLLLLVAILATVALSSTNIVDNPSNSGNFELLILHNNDMHARFEQTSQLSGTCTPADREAGKCYGGFARVAHVVKEARKAAASGEGPPVLYLNAGDTYTGTAWFTIYKWKIAAEFINALQPDAVSLGNNEIENGSSDLSPFLHALNTPILASNVILKSAEENQNLRKSVIIDVNGVKVGVVGYLLLESNVLDSTGNIEYIDEVIALQDEVANLQEQNVNIIIALGHANIDKDKEIAKEVEGIDIVIGGHKNVFFWNGTNTAKSSTKDKPIIVTQQSGRHVLVVQSYAYNKYLGEIRATFDANGEISKYRVEPILLDETIPRDSESIQGIQEHINELTTRTEEVIGNTAVVLDGESCRVEECNFGNLITDAMKYYYALRFEGERWTDAPVAIIPGGDIAASIAPANRPAPITRGDLFTALPTESHLVTVTMNGNVLLEVLEHSVSSFVISNPTGQFLQFSGVRVVYDLDKEPGQRVVSAVVRCWACFVPEYFEIDDWRDYKVLMPASLADGAYGYSMLTDLPREDLTYDEITVTEAFIEQRSPVYPEVGGRILITNLNDGDPDSATAISSTILILFVALIPFFVNY